MAKDIYNKDKTIILVFADFTYLNVLTNWIYAINRLNIQNYLIISLDKKIFKYLKNNQINTVLRPCKIQRESIWIHRINIIDEFLRSGIDIIHSDTDAVWLRDPLLFLKDIHHDLIFSQGTVWPYDTYKKWGFVLCCGFFLIRNSSSSLAFLNKVKQRIIIEKDDQVSSNRQLLDMEISWETQDNLYSLEYKNEKFLCSDKIREGKSDDLTVALLPHRYFQRVFEESDDVYVRHLISENNNESIKDILKRNNCWFLD